jgi:hypothetical protein
MGKRSVVSMGRFRRVLQIKEILVCLWKMGWVFSPSLWSMHVRLDICDCNVWYCFWYELYGCVVSHCTEKDCWLKVLERCSCHLGSLLTYWWKSVHRYDWFSNWHNCFFQNNSKLEVLLCVLVSCVFFVTKNGDRGSTSECKQIRFTKDDLIWYWRHQKQFLFRKWRVVFLPFSCI